MRTETWACGVVCKTRGPPRGNHVRNGKQQALEPFRTGKGFARCLRLVAPRALRCGLLDRLLTNRTLELMQEPRTRSARSFDLDFFGI